MAHIGYDIKGDLGALCMGDSDRVAAHCTVCARGGGVRVVVALAGRASHTQRGCRGGVRAWGGRAHKTFHPTGSRKPSTVVDPTVAET